MSDSITDMWRSPGTSDYTNKSNDSELLKKFSGTPGQMTISECKKVKKFLLEYVKIRDTYREAFNSEPIGLTLESHLEKIDWYIDFHNKGE